MFMNREIRRKIQPQWDSATMAKMAHCWTCSGLMPKGHGLLLLAILFALISPRVTSGFEIQVFDRK